MSELISRKSVLDKIEKALLIDDLTVGEKTVLSDVATMISLEPTVDTRKPMANIVEKLEREKSKSIYDSDSAIDVKGAYTNAINIVKQEINKEN